jgi:hypothetical protein
MVYALFRCCHQTGYALVEMTVYIPPTAAAVSLGGQKTVA